MIVGPETLHDCIMNIGVLIYCLVQREVEHVHVWFFSHFKLLFRNRLKAGFLKFAHLIYYKYACITNS
jgi:hypothetical protein